MSLLSREQLRIFIAPRQLDLVLLRRHGRQLADSRVVACPAPAPGESPWQPVLLALEAVLAEFRHHKTDVSVVLSNHFVRYALIRHVAELNGPDEELALIHHHYSQVYGAEAEHWQYRLSDSGGNEAYRVAAAVDRRLSESLAALFAQGKLALVSMQPHLMSAFNAWRRELGDDAWFVIVEPGVLCLARFAGGAWRFLRTVNSNGDWQDDLATNLLRAKLVAREMGAELPVYVFAPGEADGQQATAEFGDGQMFADHPLRLLRSAAFAADVARPGIPLVSLALTG